MQKICKFEFKNLNETIIVSILEMFPDTSISDERIVFFIYLVLLLGPLKVKRKFKYWIMYLCIHTTSLGPKEKFSLSFRVVPQSASEQAD